MHLMTLRTLKFWRCHSYAPVNTNQLQLSKRDQASPRRLGLRCVSRSLSRAVSESSLLILHPKIDDHDDQSLHRIGSYRVLSSISYCQNQKMCIKVPAPRLRPSYLVWRLNNSSNSSPPVLVSSDLGTSHRASTQARKATHLVTYTGVPMGRTPANGAQRNGMRVRSFSPGFKGGWCRDWTK